MIFTLPRAMTCVFKSQLPDFNFKQIFKYQINVCELFHHASMSTEISYEKASVLQKFIITL